MQEFWVFGYGSLMWRPGFDFIEQSHARLNNLHRKLCIYSHVHRGTPDKPGLVMGLDHGGSCDGMAFQVAPDKWDDTVAYLRQREQVTMVYIESNQTITLLGNTPRDVTALTYVVDREHAQYAGALSIDEQMGFITQGHGQGGACSDYVLATADHLVSMDIHDEELESLRHRIMALQG